MSRVPINVVLLAPQIPHNTGAIGRLCVGLGASLHLIRPLGFMLSANAIRRSGLDYWPHLDVTVHDNWETFLEATQPVQLCFASTKATASLYDCPFRPGCCLVFGNEGEGLPSVFYTRYASDLWQIPMPGEHARSLNLATAVAIVMYEAYRQLRVPSL